MRAGTLNKIIKIQKSTPVTNSLGEQKEHWSDVFVGVYASINPIKQSEKVEGKQLVASSTHVITIRFVTPISPKYRIKFGDRLFSIDSVLNVGERDKTLNLICTEKVT
ncbi:MAG: phage head closure protein [Epsilonproteobacteria bacterium]|nr:phage head closure protein [Campylobacterota bacterium]